MFKYLKRDTWSPYVVGVCLGVLSWATFIFMRHMIGSSTTFVRIAALFWRIINPQHLVENRYYMKYLAEGFWLNWQFAMILGVFVGSWIASHWGKVDKAPAIPKIWKRRFGTNATIYDDIFSFVGGILVLFGARLAGGCTSGHIISGGMQLVASSWVFMIGVFAVGVPTAFIIFGRKGGK
jgi:uncharacterized membrane protein YedE/YeeE